MSIIKKISFIAFVLFSTNSWSDTTYFIGERVERSIKGEVSKKSMLGTLNSQKSSLVWSIIRCELPGNVNCLSYQIALRQKPKGGGWIFEIPGTKGLVSVPAVTDSKVSPPTHFNTKWNGDDNKHCCAFVHKSANEKTIWIQVYNEKGDTITTTTTLSKIDKSAYDELATKRKAKPY